MDSQLGNMQNGVIYSCEGHANNQISFTSLLRSIVRAILLLSGIKAGRVKATLPGSCTV